MPRKIRHAMVILPLLLPVYSFAQNLFFDQDFSSGGPYESGTPSTTMFDKILSTDSQSFAEFGAGYMDLVRTGAGGLVRAIRSTPLSPTPSTLYAQITMSVEEVLSAGNNAVYFYTGRDFRTDNSSIVPNDNLFSRFSLTFTDDNSFFVRDLQTNTNSAPMAVKSVFTITWVMNNSAEGHVYRMPESAATPDYKVMPGQYDLWVDNNRMVNGAAAYPGGSSGFNSNQLTNFEVKFWNALGRIRFYNFKFRDIAGILPVNGLEVTNSSYNQQKYAIVSPNPSSASAIRIKYDGEPLSGFILSSTTGVVIESNWTKIELPGWVQLILPHSLPAGVYILSFYQGAERVFKKVVIK